MKKALFLHPNFPGQFKHHCRNLKNAGFEVLFLCHTHYGREEDGVTKIAIKKKVKREDGTINSQVFDVKSQIETSKVYRAAFEQLQAKGWNPDYVISHSGWGCGIYVKAIWPECQLISYMEWWFNPKSQFYYYDENNKDLGINKKSALNHWDKNQLLALELLAANTIISPTRWQRSQLPRILKENTHIVYDGIDLNKFKSPRPTRSNIPLITYGTRGMEPVRAFNKFIEEIPNILKLNDYIEVEIAGIDQIYYGGRLPEGFKSWGLWAQNYLERHNISKRVRWLGYLEEKDYLSWLNRSWCHIYLSHPYVLSWSFIEAYINGCPIVCSDVQPVIEFASKGCVMVDHREKGSICNGVKKVLQDKNRWVKSKNRVIEGIDQKEAFARFARVTGVELATTS